MLVWIGFVVFACLRDESYKIADDQRREDVTLYVLARWHGDWRGETVKVVNSS